MHTNPGWAGLGSRAGMFAQGLTRSCAAGSLVGGAEPMTPDTVLEDVVAAVPEHVNVPTMEKGDEPLSEHHEEMGEVADKAAAEEGLGLIQKLGALGVIVAICLVFVRGRGTKVPAAGRHGAYAKSMA